MRYVPVENARKQLGRLIREVSSGDPIVVGRRGADRAVLISEGEYERLREIEEKAALARFQAALEAIGADVRREKLSQEVVDEAIRAIRRR
jgi:prevent-host-death family protein